MPRLPACQTSSRMTSGALLARGWRKRIFGSLRKRLDTSASNYRPPLCDGRSTTWQNRCTVLSMSHRGGRRRRHRCKSSHFHRRKPHRKRRHLVAPFSRRGSLFGEEMADQGEVLADHRRGSVVGDRLHSFARALTQNGFESPAKLPGYTENIRSLSGSHLVGS